MNVQSYILICVGIAGTFLYNWNESQKNKEEIKKYKIESSRIMAIDSLHSLEERKLRNKLDSTIIKYEAKQDSLYLELRQIKRNEWRLKNEIDKLNTELEPLPEL
jgi:hypothetical protein